MNFYIVAVFCGFSWVVCDGSLPRENYPEETLFSQNPYKKFRPVSTTDSSASLTIKKPYKAFNTIEKPFHIYRNTIIRGPPKDVDDTISNLVTENVIESKPLVIRKNASNPQHHFIKQPEKANVVDWFLGLVGIRQPDPNAAPVEPAKICPSCTCGKTFKNVRIVGGIETMVNEYPWMTALLYNNRFYCGASLINNKYCLTAAHCVNGFTKEKITAVFLDHDRSSSFETNTISRKVKNIFRHRGYSTGGTYNNDIAIIELDQEVPLTGMLRPVCLPPTGKSFTGLQGIATGWGATKQNGQTSNKLREVKVPIMSNIDCRKTGYGNKITDNMLCAGYQGGLKDSCQGDSGGPLHTKNGSFHQIVGVVSWGEGCAKPNYPGVYTRVNRYISWIKTNTKDACYCNS
ncbi:trypsin-1-like [Diabrotica undecimpunctata]|uniref:trypsin-1-like n=1 Tax=Diabrotica undecimpunctata TaxID=50387 RepID=UPI003B63741B